MAGRRQFILEMTILLEESYDFNSKPPKPALIEKIKASFKSVSALISAANASVSVIKDTSNKALMLYLLIKQANVTKKEMADIKSESKLEYSEKQLRVLRWMNLSDKFIVDLSNTLADVFQHIISWVEPDDADGLKTFTMQLWAALIAVMEEKDPPRSNPIIVLVKDTILHIRNDAPEFNVQIIVDNRCLLGAGYLVNSMDSQGILYKAQKGPISFTVQPISNVSFRDIIAHTRLIRENGNIWERRGIIHNNEFIPVFDYPPLSWHHDHVQLGYNQPYTYRETSTVGGFYIETELNVVQGAIENLSADRLLPPVFTERFRNFRSLWNRQSLPLQQKELYVRNIVSWLGERRELFVSAVFKKLEDIFKLTMTWITGRNRVDNTKKFANTLVDLLVTQMVQAPPNQDMNSPDVRAYSLIRAALMRSRDAGVRELAETKIEAGVPTNDGAALSYWELSINPGVLRRYPIENKDEVVTFGSILNNSPVIDPSNGDLRKLNNEVKRYPALRFSASEMKELGYEMKHEIKLERLYELRGSIKYFKEIKIADCPANALTPVIDIFRGIRETFWCSKQEDQEDDLRIAASKGQLDTVKELIDKDVNLNGRGTTRSLWTGLLYHQMIDQTALMLAAEYGHTDVVRLLVANKADTDYQSNTGYTALDYALKCRKYGTANYLHTVKRARRNRPEYSGESNERVEAITTLINTFEPRANRP